MHGGLGWIAYNSQFRQQAVAGSRASWSELNPSLMAATVLNAGSDASGRVCTLCLAADHSKQDCALLSLEAATHTPKPPPSATGAMSRFKPYNLQEEICRQLNWGSCTAMPCRFEHICFSCQKPAHGSHECRKGMVRTLTRDASSSQQKQS